jgi:hypothetical protein
MPVILDFHELEIGMWTGEKAHFSLKFQGLHNILDQEMINLWEELYNLTDEYTDRWLSSGIWILHLWLLANVIVSLLL